MAKRKNPHAVALGRKGGRVMTPKKLEALKRNAQRAGRKPKFQVGDRVRILDNAPTDYKGGVGTIAAREARAEYRVEGISGAEQREGVLMSWWLEMVRH